MYVTVGSKSTFGARTLSGVWQQMLVFALFLAVPLIEIALFITVGGWLTLWPTLALVVATAVIGSALVRVQGLEKLKQIQRSLDGMQDPLTPFAHGALILLAGIFLITPGFFTDFIGFSLLIPPVRQGALRLLARRVGFVQAVRPKARDDVLEGDYTDVTADTQRGDAPLSGWTRHDPPVR